MITKLKTGENIGIYTYLYNVTILFSATTILSAVFQPIK